MRICSHRRKIVTDAAFVSLWQQVLRLERREMFIMAIILQVNSGNLMVRNFENNQEILVHFRDSRNFRSDEHVRIEFNGQMTLSIPPQITAISILRIHHPTPPSPPRSTEMRATVLQRRANSLLVRNMSNNRQLIVNTPHARHFCARQRIIVRYNSIIMNNPPEVTAIDITAIC